MRNLRRCTLSLGLAVTLAACGTEPVLDTITIDRNNWPLPIDAPLSTLQTTNHFMAQTAKKSPTG